MGLELIFNYNLFSNDDLVQGIECTVNQNNWRHFYVKIEGPSQTSYEGNIEPQFYVY